MSNYPAEQFAAVVVISGVPKALSYSIPAEQQHRVEVGTEVSVELGSRRTTGYVIEKVPLAAALEKFNATPRPRRTTSQVPDSQLALFSPDSLKQAARSTSAPPSRIFKPVLAASKAFLASQLPLFEWIAEYYGSTLGDVLENAIPQKTMGKTPLFVELTQAGFTLLGDEGEERTKLKKRAPAQAQMLDIIQELALDSTQALEVSQLAQEFPQPPHATLKALQKKGLLRLFSPTRHELEQMRVALLDHTSPSFLGSGAPANLTRSQEQALSLILPAIQSGTHSTKLLFGVTGSGKTEVYLRGIQEALRLGKTALVIVPEIALTPQLVDYFELRLKIPIGLLHSQVGSGARWSAWERLLSGELQVALGARSAVFAPVKNLGLIIVDEEHESSYKQSDGLRYHARDVAVMRGKLENCPVVLGSATPSFESIYQVKSKEYELVELPERVTTRPLPEIEVVPLNKIKRREMVTENLSPRLYEAMKEALERKEQIVILYNRRGFSSYLQCRSCAEVVTCPNCSVTLTYHKKRNQLICHYCNLTSAQQTYCGYCRNPKASAREVDRTGAPAENDETAAQFGLLEHRGGGTEKVVQEIHELFPTATLARMDRDTVGEKGSYRRILTDMKSGRADILIGTQMVAKGHDIPGVSLVGIIDADVGLHLPDFRAGEKAYQLLTQASGRAGRAEISGKVVLQTREPNHPAIVALTTGRFKAFVRFELKYRESLRYPPAGRMMRLIISSADLQKAHEYAHLVAETLSDYVQSAVEHKDASLLTDNPGNPLQLSVLGPAPAAYEKLRARYRWHILIKSNSKRVMSELAQKLSLWRDEQKGREDFRLAVDVDPVDML